MQLFRWKYLCSLLLCGSALAQSPDPLLDAAREAWARRDRPRLNALADQAIAGQHALAPWVDYWRQFARLSEATVPELDAFYARWRGSYVEDRLRNDWLLVLGRRGDWAAFAADYPRFRMDDDRTVHCMAISAEQAQGKPLKPAEGKFRERALAVWLAQRDADEACHAMAETLLQQRVLLPADLQRKLLRTAEEGRGGAFRQAAGLHKAGKVLLQAYEQPERFLTRRGKARGALPALESSIAIVRLAASDPGKAVAQLRRLDELPPTLRQWAWLHTARAALLRLQPESIELLREALAVREDSSGWSDDSHAAAARIALRAGDWPLLQERVKAMPERLRDDSAWAYWGAQAAYRSAPEGAQGDNARREARAQLQRLASPLHFYGQLASDELGLRLPLPPAPAALEAAERQGALEHPGLRRALSLMAAGLRSEGVREWNFSLRGMDDRQLLAAAQLACERELWDRCINTSDRTRLQVDLSQRYPMPYREQLLTQARAVGLDPADPFGLIRQESRFIPDARSGVGATGLMQVMPTTARWTAKKMGIPYGRAQLADPELNLRIGMQYLRMVLDDFGGALPLAAAAYNAGPGRPRRWREGMPLDAAAWAETIPFLETRDYVKKVLANATVYARLLGAEQTTLRQRLGQQVGPRLASARPVNEELP